MMKTITRVNHIGIRVKDFDTSVAFYAQLGFKYIAGPIGPEPVAIVEHRSGVNINFVLNANQPETLNQLMDVPTKYTGYTHVALEVTNTDKTIEYLTRIGVELSGGPMHHPTGTSVFIRDPDRNVIEFVEYNGLDSLINQQQP